MVVGGEPLALGFGGAEDGGAANDDDDDVPEELTPLHRRWFLSLIPPVLFRTGFMVHY